MLSSVPTTELVGATGGTFTRTALLDAAVSTCRWLKEFVSPIQ
jgi:hypothetical protein